MTNSKKRKEKSVNLLFLIQRTKKNKNYVKFLTIIDQFKIRIFICRQRDFSAIAMSKDERGRRRAECTPNTSSQYSTAYATGFREWKFPRCEEESLRAMCHCLTY